MQQRNLPASSWCWRRNASAAASLRRSQANAPSGPNSRTGPRTPSAFALASDTESRKNTNRARPRRSLSSPERKEPCVIPYTPNGFPKCFTKAATSSAATSDGPEPCRRKSHHPSASASSGLEALPSPPMLPFTMRRAGKRRCSIAATSSVRSAEAHSRTSASGRCFSRSASTPGVCAMSPMFTTCHEERSRIRGRRPGSPARSVAASAETSVVWTKRRRSMEVRVATTRFYSRRISSPARGGTPRRRSPRRRPRRRRRGRRTRAS